MKLIDKAALVAEIDKLKKEIESQDYAAYTEAYIIGVKHTIETISDILDTFEVKEVDLEKEIDKFYGMYRKDGQTFSLEDNEECVDWKVDCNPEFVKYFAKYFFELGLKLQKEE